MIILSNDPSYFIYYSVVTYEKNGDPSKTDIVKRNGSLERILFSGFAIGVILIPVDTRGIESPGWAGAAAGRADGQGAGVRHTRNGAVVTVPAFEAGRRKSLARVHPIIFGQGADVVLLRLLNLVVAG